MVDESEGRSWRSPVERTAEDGGGVDGGAGLPDWDGVVRDGGDEGSGGGGGGRDEGKCEGAVG